MVTASEVSSSLDSNTHLVDLRTVLCIKISIIIIIRNDFERRTKKQRTIIQGTRKDVENEFLTNGFHPLAIP